MINLSQLGFACEAGDKNIVYDDREWFPRRRRRGKG